VFCIKQWIISKDKPDDETKLSKLTKLNAIDPDSPTEVDVKLGRSSFKVVNSMSLIVSSLLAFELFVGIAYHSLFDVILFLKIGVELKISQLESIN
jgi:hypothetical protein